MKNAKKFTVTITSALLAIAALTSTAEATCGFSNPTESSSFAAGDTMPISWTDIDNEGAKCEDLTLTIELRVGSRDVQETVAIVGDGIDGSTGGTSYPIPKQLSKTDDTYFLEMHDSAKGFQNFSARFSITGVEGGGDSPSGKNGTEPDPEAGQEEEPKGKGKSDDDTPNDKTTDDEASNSTGTDNETDESNNSPTKDQNGNSGSGTGNQPNGGGNAGGASSTNSPGNTTSPSDNPEPNAASSWFVSFASLAIVTVAVSLSNMF